MTNSAWWEGFPNFGKRTETDAIIFPAAERNRVPILETLQNELPKYFNLEQKLFWLEIASGSGQHTAYFAPNFPNITFQPSEYAADLLPSISAYANECTTKNIKKPLHIDISKDLKIHGFKEKQIDVLYCVNLVHVAPFECAISLFANAHQYLKPEGLLITYGAYALKNEELPEGNFNFEKKLRAHDSTWGLRTIEDLIELAEKNNMTLKDKIDLPANNKFIIWANKSH